MKKKKLHPIVENINKIVKDRKMSKMAFADLIGLPESKWNKISNGAQELSLWELSKIAEVLQMPLQNVISYPDKYVKCDAIDTGERISVTFEVSPDKRDILLNLVTKQDKNSKL